MMIKYPGNSFSGIMMVPGTNPPIKIVLKLKVKNHAQNDFLLTQLLAGVILHKWKEQNTGSRGNLAYENEVHPPVYLLPATLVLLPPRTPNGTWYQVPGEIMDIYRYLSFNK
jgi:hypothetical protein